MMQGFRPSVLMGHTDRMSEAIFREVDRLPDGVVDLRLFCMRVIIAMMARVLVQKDLPEGMDRTMALSNREMLKSSNMGWKRWLWYKYPPKLWKRHKIFKYLGSILDERAQGGEPDKEDILSAVVSAQEKDYPEINRTELIHDLSQLFMAGSTTSSMIIAWSLIHSFSDTAWLEELRSELSDWDPYKFDSIDPYPKLRATTLEIERLHPGVPIFNRVTAEAFEFNGYRIPKGADVLHLHTLAHFMEEFYDDPDVFGPLALSKIPTCRPKMSTAPSAAVATNASAHHWPASSHRSSPRISKVLRHGVFDPAVAARKIRCGRRARRRAAHGAVYEAELGHSEGDFSDTWRDFSGASV